MIIANFIIVIEAKMIFLKKIFMQLHQCMFVNYYFTIKIEKENKILKLKKKYIYINR